MMKNFRYIAIFLLVSVAHAADVPLVFKDPAQQDRYQHLLRELRCLVCQNQNLEDSHADLAQDLRQQIFNMMAEGRTDQEIVGYLVDRYGDFVLYRPPLHPYTVLLWFGPFILLFIALFVVYRQVRSARPVDVSLKEADRAALSRLLDETDGDGV